MLVVSFKWLVSTNFEGIPLYEEETLVFGGCEDLRNYLNEHSSIIVTGVWRVNGDKY